jgi:hypothetical protein
MSRRALAALVSLMFARVVSAADFSPKDFAFVLTKEMGENAPR